MVLRRTLSLAAILGVLLLDGFAQTAASPPGLVSTGESAFTDWARHSAVPLKTILPDDDFSDMKRVGNIVGNARIVGLGEATRGTSEFFQMKDRMVRYLATQKGFTIFAIEANMPEAYHLDDYVLNGTGDARTLLRGMYFWTWNTQEVLDMILWMRQYNQSGKGRIEFTGFDMQTPTLSLENVRQFVEKYDPEYLPTLAANYKEVEKTQPGEEPPFGSATAQLPVSVAAGHSVHLSGYIKTENIENGFAGFWIRADGPPGTGSLAFDNMQDCAPRGTTPWTPYEITVKVPGNARTVDFGAVHSGSGTAWFDSLQIDIDGVPYTNPGAVDLDFESPTPGGFLTGGDGYQVQIDATTSHTGQQSLKIEAANSTPQPAVPTVQPSGLLRHCANVLNDLTAKRESILEAGASPKEVDWAIQNARLVLQFAELKAEGMTARDRAMAENIRWIADQNPGAKIIVWAHNGHIGYLPEGSSMGSYLKKYFGTQYMNFGFAFDQGSFRAFDLERLRMTTFNVLSAPEGTWDEALAATNIPIFALDLRMAISAPELVKWMDAKHRTRSLGAAYSEGQSANYWADTQLQDEFDAIFFIERTTASHPLP